MSDNEAKLIMELTTEAMMCLIKCFRLIGNNLDTRHGFIDIMKEFLDGYDERKTL